MEFKDYYTILGVDKKASADEVKKAYRRLARKYHPDVSKEKNAEEEFKAVQEAYTVLKDKEKRAAYDQLGSGWQQGQDFRPPPNWDENAHSYTSGGRGAFSEEDLGGFSDFFSELFGRQSRGAGRRAGFGGVKHRGSDQNAKISVSLTEAFHGVARTLQLQVPEVDQHGQVRQTLRKIKVNIPKGVKQGRQLRLAGQGAPGIGGGPAGDLFLEIQIEPHPYFVLQGNDVYLTLPVSPWEAALGATINIPTLAGKVDMKIAPGSQAGKKLRLKNRGMPGKPDGDQYVILQILTPPAETAEQKALYEKMAKEIPFDPRKDWLR